MEDFAQQLNLFNFGKETFKIDKPIRLIELFAGIGAQAKALEILGVPFEHYKICEWAAPSIKGYNAIHIQDHTDYSANLTKEQLIDYLDGNISTDYNEPCNCKKKPESWLREVYNNCVATHNLMNIMKVKGEDLCIVDRKNFCYLMTYSFPCQDLSLAGTRKGMATSQANGGTRSGLLWEVERILTELGKNLPQVLLMENVPEVIGANNVEHFNKWLAKLESLGYSNYFQVLNAKDYGIPQNRRRCFMVSILGEYAYDFPLKMKLKYKLKDFLNAQVDEKYYLSDEMISYITATGTKDFNVSDSKINCSNARPLTTEHNKRAGTTNYICDELPENTDLRKVGNVGNGHHSKDVFSAKGIMPTLTTGNHNNGQLIAEQTNDKCEQVGNLNYYNHEQSDMVYGHNGLSPTIRTGCDDAKAIKIIEDKGSVGFMIKENNSKGFKVAKEGDGVNLASRMAHQRGNVQRESLQTLKTQMEVGVVVNDKKKANK